MTTFRNIQEIERVGMRWTIVNFIPAQPAFDWPEPKGKLGFIYAVGCGEFTKIGMSKNFEKRFRDISAGIPYEAVKLMIRSVPLAGMAYAEAWLLNHFKEYHLKNEWFNLDRSLLRGAFAKAVKRAEVYEQCCAEWSWEHWEKFAADEKRVAKAQARYDEAVAKLKEMEAQEALARA